MASEKIDQDTQQKIQELQVLEHNMQNLLMQKQAFQMEINETANALDELKNTNEDVYKMVGSIMIKGDKEKIIKELGDKKNVLDLRMESLDKQEKLIESKAKEIHEGVKKSMEKSKK